MVKLSELKTAADVRAGDMKDLAHRREYERTRLANDVAIKVLQYRQVHGLSQTELAALLDMRQATGIQATVTSITRHAKPKKS